MWIRDNDGDYFNLDHCRQIYTDEDGCTHFCFDRTAVIVNYDVKDKVIQNIISGTKYLEV